MRKYFKFAFRQHRLKILLILILSIIQTYFQLAIIDLFKSALQHVKTEEIPLLNADGLLMLAYSVILIASMIAVMYLANNLTVSITHKTRAKIFHIESYLPPDEFNKFTSTDLMSRVVGEVSTEESFIQTFLKNILIIPFVTVGIIIAVSLIDNEFGFFLTIFVILLFIYIIYKLKNVTDVYFSVKKTNGRVNFLFREKIAGLKTIKVFKKKFFERKKFDAALTDSYDSSLKFQLGQYYLPPLFILVSDLFVVVLMIYLFDFSIDPSISVINHSRYYNEFVNIVVIIQYMIYFASVLLSLHSLIEVWPKAYSSSIRIEEMLDLEEKITENKSKTLKSDFKGIEFRNVSFENDEHEIIRNITLKIPDKSTIAIVGPYSSGKSVLMYLLTGAYRADEGEILIDGYDINDLTSSELRDKINIALQKNFIFHDTLYNNLVLGDNQIIKSDVVKACDATGLSELFNDEFNLDTMILENASNISNGTKKKIMLTRSIVREKDIYIFDEHDYRIENKTNIILTKKIEQIKDIAHIVVLDKGRIVGEGTHEELLSSCLVYQKLHGEGE